MPAVKKLHWKSQGISVITCTNRKNYIKNIFRNYSRQIWRKKELVIVINHDDIKMRKYIKMGKKYKNVSVYRLPEVVSLGECLNFGVRKSKYGYIAKFDDDDYYAPLYLTEAMQTFQRSHANIIGKKTHFFWLSGRNTLVLRFPNKFEQKRVSDLPGATLVFQKSVFKKVQFPNISLGEDTYFCLKCHKKGLKLYSGGKFNFVAVRRKLSKNHTWVFSEKIIMQSNSKIYGNVLNFKKFVSR